MKFEAIIKSSGDDERQGRWMVVREGTVLDSHPDDAVGVDFDIATEFDTDEPAHVIARADGTTYWALGVPEATAAPAGHEFRDLYSMHAVASPTEWALAGRAVQIVEWARTHRFCGRCGQPTEPVVDDRAVRCSSCGLVAFPRLAPAVITLVHRGDEALLARGVRFPRPMYSTLAGFVEPGESVEHAVHREIFEEVGITVDNLVYHGSQPWPFPHSLMLGFTAEWVDGAVAIDAAEIIDAGWYRYDDLPEIPPPVSIARQLIDRWVAERTG